MYNSLTIFKTRNDILESFCTNLFSLYKNIETATVTLFICCPGPLYQDIRCYYTILNYQMLVDVAAPTSHSRHLPLGTECNHQALVLP
jgi:hypothetical protein